MSDKNYVSICPTGHEGWLKHFLGSDIPTPVTHRFTDPITKERVESNTSFPGKSVIASAVVKVLEQVDREGNCFKKVLFDSPYLFNSGVDVTPIFSGRGLVAYSVRSANPRYTELLLAERLNSKFYTELSHPFRKM